MEPILISIIIPVYKVEKYLDRCLESVVNQTYKNLEIILIDDSSPDNCPKMCDEWAEKDSRIKVLHIENKGVANARNIGLSIATGDYIGFVDSDDYIELNMYEVLLSNLVDTNSDISVCGYQINEETDVDSNYHSVSQFDALKMICVGDYKYGVLWNKLYKRSVVDGIIMPNFVCSEDLVYNYYAFKNAASIVECDSKLYHYCQNENSTVHSEFKIGAFDAVTAKEIILNNEKGTKLEPYAIKGLINSCFVVLSGIIQSGKFFDKYDYLRNNIYKYKKTIYGSSLYSKEDRIKTRTLMFSKRLYNFLIKIKNCI